MVPGPDNHRKSCKVWNIRVKIRPCGRSEPSWQWCVWWLCSVLCAGGWQLKEDQPSARPGQTQPASQPAWWCVSLTLITRLRNIHPHLTPHTSSQILARATCRLVKIIIPMVGLLQTCTPWQMLVGWPRLRLHRSPENIWRRRRRWRQVRSANSSRQRFLSYWVYLRSDSPAYHSRNLVNLAILVLGYQRGYSRPSSWYITVTRPDKKWAN